MAQDRRGAVNIRRFDMAPTEQDHRRLLFQIQSPLSLTFTLIIRSEPGRINSPQWISSGLHLKKLLEDPGSSLRGASEETISMGGAWFDRPYWRVWIHVADHSFQNVLILWVSLRNGMKCCINTNRFRLSYFCPNFFSLGIDRPLHFKAVQGPEVSVMPGLEDITSLCFSPTMTPSQSMGISFI